MEGRKKTRKIETKEESESKIALKEEEERLRRKMI
jgi:hypothetical protein